MYRSELYAILLALEVFRGDLEIVSDCKGVMDEAERIRNGGRVNPISRHADLWARYSEALKAQGVRSALVRWVPSHEEEGSDRIPPGDRAGNDHADGLANAHAIGSLGQRHPRRRDMIAGPSSWRRSKGSNLGSSRPCRTPTHGEPRNRAHAPAPRERLTQCRPAAGSVTYLPCMPES